MSIASSSLLLGVVKDHSDIVGEVDMATRHHQAVVSQQQRGITTSKPSFFLIDLGFLALFLNFFCCCFGFLGDAVHAGKQKVVAGADGRNRQALGDIGNLVNLRGPDG